MSARKLTAEPADTVAAKRAEQARKAAAYDDAVSVLEAKLGPSWTIGCPTVAEALVEPHTLRVLLGVPHPGPGERRFDAGPGFIRARECPDCGHTRCGEDCTCNCDAVHAEHEAAQLRQQFADTQPVTAIDDTTPEGVLALLDAAIEALGRREEAHLTEGVIDERDDLAFELGLDLRDADRFDTRRANQLAARLGLDKPRAPNALDAQVGALAPLDGSRLLARFRRLAAGVDEIIANPSDSGWSERQHLTMLAAICLALVTKLTADTTGGAS
jgi:hypothetical protein